MSHFLVLVTETNKVDLGQQLEPFNEQGDDGAYYMQKKYVCRNDSEEIEKYLKEEESKILEYLERCKKANNGKGLSYVREELRRIRAIQKLKTNTGKLKALTKYTLYPRDEGGIYYIYNPNAQWDWWVEGGRWSDWLIDKEGHKGNSCAVGNIDWKAMKAQEAKNAAEYYDAEIKRSKESGRQPFFFDFEKTPSRRQYIRHFEKGTIAPYAYLHRGEWVSKGEMGWFGHSKANYTQRKWQRKFKKFLKTLDKDTIVTIVDCHI